MNGQCYAESVELEEVGTM